MSADCRDLIGRIFQADPDRRATVEDIRRHPWFLRDLPPELAVRGPMRPFFLFLFFGLYLRVDTEGQGLNKVRPSPPAARAAVLRRRVVAWARATARVRVKSRARLWRSCVAGAPQAGRRHALRERLHTSAARELRARTRRAAAPGSQVWCALEETPSRVLSRHAAWRTIHAWGRPAHGRHIACGADPPRTRRRLAAEQGAARAARGPLSQRAPGPACEDAPGLQLGLV